MNRDEVNLVLHYLLLWTHMHIPVSYMSIHRTVGTSVNRYLIYIFMYYKAVFQSGYIICQSLRYSNSYAVLLPIFMCPFPNHA